MYLVSSSGRGYTSIEVGGVERVTFRLILTNNGDEEDAIRLSLAVNHSRSGVFLDQFTITFSDVCTSPACCILIPFSFLLTLSLLIPLLCLLI